MMEMVLIVVLQEFMNGNGTNTWVQLGQDIDGEAAGDNSGYLVSLNSQGNIVAIGAPDNDGNGNISGHTRIYEWNGTSWVQFRTRYRWKSSF